MVVKPNRSQQCSILSEVLRFVVSVVIMKWILWMIRPPVESVKRNFNCVLRDDKKKHHAGLSIKANLHEKLHKTNILVEPINCLHFILREREVEYLQERQVNGSLFHTFYFRGSLGFYRNGHTSKFSFIRAGLKLFGMTTTPLCTLNLRDTCAVVFLYFLAMDVSSSSSNNGGHLRLTLFERCEKITNQMMTQTLYCCLKIIC